MSSSRRRRRCSSLRRWASNSPIWRTWLLSSSRSRGIDQSSRVGRAPTAQRADVFEVAYVGQLDELQAVAGSPFEPRDLTIVDALLQPQVLDGAAHGVDQDRLADRAMRDHHHRLGGMRRHALGEERQRALLRLEQGLAVRQAHAGWLCGPCLQAAWELGGDLSATL